jgi:hypothetical protein
VKKKSLGRSRAPDPDPPPQADPEPVSNHEEIAAEMRARAAIAPEPDVRAIRKGGMGWGCNVATDEGCIRRYIYKTKRQAQAAKKEHRIGDAGRIR